MIFLPTISINRSFYAHLPIVENWQQFIILHNPSAGYPLERKKVSFPTLDRKAWPLMTYWHSVFQFTHPPRRSSLSNNVIFQPPHPHTANHFARWIKRVPFLLMVPIIKLNICSKKLFIFDMFEQGSADLRSIRHVCLHNTGALKGISRLQFKQTYFQWNFDRGDGWSDDWSLFI